MRQSLQAKRHLTMRGACVGPVTYCMTSLELVHTRRASFRRIPHEMMTSFHPRNATQKHARSALIHDKPCQSLTFGSLAPAGGLFFALKSSAISLIVTHSTSSCVFTHSMNRSSMSRTSAGQRECEMRALQLAANFELPRDLAGEDPCGRRQRVGFSDTHVADQKRQDGSSTAR